MIDWNVVISVNEHGFEKTFRALGEFGPVKRSSFYNVLVMKTADIRAMLDVLTERAREEPDSISFISKLIPVTLTFTFQSAEEFREKARNAVLSWAPDLQGKSFHVRMHRRGMKGSLSSLGEEAALDKVLLEQTSKSGEPGRISFEDPDFVIAIETVANRAGLSLWSREDLQRYPFIRPD